MMYFAGSDGAGSDNDRGHQMGYYAIGNVVYDQNGSVMLVVANVLFRKWVAKKAAEMIAAQMNELDYDTRETLLGGDFH